MTERRTGHFAVRDKERTLEFDGVLLGEASSEDGVKSRWIEIAIYRTESGRYVIAGNGRSIVPGESDRPWAHVAETPRGAVEQLYMFDDDGVRYLTRVARRALSEARANDPALNKAYLVEAI